MEAIPMDLNKEDILKKLLEVYSHHYDIDRDGSINGAGHYPATATYFLRDENYLLTKKHVLNAVENYDYMYFLVAENLDAETLRREIDFSLAEGMKRIKPHKEHMSSFITLVVIADSIEPEAKKLLKRTNRRKYFWLALHGWMEYHIAAIETTTQSFLSNPAGRDVRKTLEANFGPKAKRRESIK